MNEEIQKKIKLLGAAAAVVVTIIVGVVLFFMMGNRGTIDSPVKVDEIAPSNEVRGNKKEGRGVSDEVNTLKNKKDDKAGRGSSEDSLSETTSSSDSDEGIIEEDKQEESPDLDGISKDDAWATVTRKDQVAKPHGVEDGFKKDKDGETYFEMKGTKGKDGAIKFNVKDAVYLEDSSKRYFRLDELTNKQITENISNWVLSTQDVAKELGYKRTILE